jgi:hypothetical protein
MLRKNSIEVHATSMEIGNWMSTILVQFLQSYGKNLILSTYNLPLLSQEISAFL